MAIIPGVKKNSYSYTTEHRIRGIPSKGYYGPSALLKFKNELRTQKNFFFTQSFLNIQKLKTSNPIWLNEKYNDRTKN